MPRRTNLFQRVIKVLHENIAGQATVEESAMLPDSASQSDREVDVVITTTLVGQTVRIGVEATATGSPADVTWVDSMIGKHRTLPTNRLVLVSEAGFTPAARRKAESEEIAALAPEDLEGEEAAGRVVNKLGTIYVKGFTFTYDVATATVHPPGKQSETVETEVPSGATLFLSDETEVGSVADAMNVYVHANFEQISGWLDLPDVTERQEREIRLTTQADLSARRPGIPLGGSSEPLFIRNEGVDPPQLWRVRKLSIKPRAVLEAGEISLSHAKLEPLSPGFAFGEGHLGESTATFIVDESGDHPAGRMILDTKEDGQLESSLNPFLENPTHKSDEDGDGDGFD